MQKGKYLRTKEHKKKMSDVCISRGIHAGEKNGMFGKKGIRAPFFGRHHSKKWKKMISNKFKGREFSQEWKNKLKKNSSHYWKGKHLSERQRKVLSKLQQGKNGSNWKGGVSRKNEILRSSLESTLWREKVFKRDNYTCQKTKIKGGSLEAHHIKNFAEYPELRFKVNNGITFSKKIHDRFHKIYGKRNNTKRQLEEFLNN